MSASVTFIHMSDLHVSDPSVVDPTLLSDTGTTLAAVAAAVATISPVPSFVAVSGDLTNRGDAESFHLVAQALSGLPCPVLYGLGNHDTRDGFLRGIAPRDPAADDEAVRDRVIDDVHVIVVDTGVPGRIGGAIDGRSFERLEETLERHAALPKILVMHHPPALDDEADWKTLARADGRRLAALLAGRHVAAILSGHIHVDRVAAWHGIPLVTVSGQHAATDPLHTDGLRMVRGASFGLCRLGPSGFSVTFVQLPSDRAELGRVPEAAILEFL